MHHQSMTTGVCARSIDFDLEGDIVHNVSFFGGCNGNLKAISKLVEGQRVSDLEAILLGNTCGYKSTSCADQLARALRAAYDEENPA